MDPYRIAVSVHDVQRIDLTAVVPIRGSTRVCRDIVIHDAHGERLVIQCFAANADALCVRDADFAEEPKCVLPEPTPTPCAGCDGAGRDFHGKCTECDGTGKARPACGHSACSQNFIETGETHCVAGEVETLPAGQVPPGLGIGYLLSERAPKWTPPANPRPHTYPEAGGNCTRCGATPHGALSRLTCGIAQAKAVRA